MHLIIFQKLLIELFLDIVYFPLWWYSGGVVYAFGRCRDLIVRGNFVLAPGLWLRNIFVPMYGQYDWQGRIISLFMRLVQVIARTVALLVWVAFSIVLFFVWFLIPVVIIWGLIHSVRGA